MNTEITDLKNETANGWVCYDADCSLCLRWARRFRPLLERNGFALVPLQSPEARRSLNLPEEVLLAEMRVITRRGSVLGGADAVLHLAKTLRWGWLLYGVACLPGVKPLLRWVYRLMARNRTCRDGACVARPARLPGVRTWPGWLPLVLATAAALILGRRLPAWGFMWALAFALFAGCKWLTFWVERARGAKPDPIRAAGYLFAWPGMDAKDFLARKPIAERPQAREWLMALAKTLFGSVLVWGLARLFPGHPLWTGWIGMAGLIFVLHFGLLHLLSLAWRKAGVNAPPLMRSPALAKSLGEFWGARWNTGFHKLADDFLFRRLYRACGIPAATMLVFLVSGLIHDLVISLPAGGGYGLPTAYFVAQGAGVLFERTGFARRCGVGRGWRGRLFAMVMTAGPAFWLFHPPFVLNVMIPFLKTIGAI